MSDPSPDTDPNDLISLESPVEPSEPAPPPEEDAGQAPAGEASPPPTVPFGERMLSAIQAKLRARGAGPRVLATVALTIAALALFAFLVNVPGVAGVLGLLALLASELARAPAAGDDAKPDPLARGLDLPVDLLLAAGVAGNAAVAGADVNVILGLVALILFAWLPHLRAAGPDGGLAPQIGVWHRYQRVGLLLVGLTIGRPFVTLVMVVGVCSLDAWWRLDRLRRGHEAGARAAPGFLGPLVAEDGALQPIVRWGSLVVAVLLLLVLPQSESWQFWGGGA